MLDTIYGLQLQPQCRPTVLSSPKTAATSPSAKSIQEDEIPLAVIVGRMKKFSENTSTIPEVMDSSTLNFNPNFKFSRFFGVGDPRPPSGV